MAKGEKQETSEQGIRIETGVAPPSTSGGGRKYPFPELAAAPMPDPNDPEYERKVPSFFVPRPPPEKSDPHGALYAGAKRAGIKVTVSERKPAEHGEDGFRVFLVEKLAK